MSEKLEEILKRFKDDWDALERELRKLIDELLAGDKDEFPGFDPKTHVPFLRLVFEECALSKADDALRTEAIKVTLDMVERIRQEISKVGFWKSDPAKELLTKRLVRDLDDAKICSKGKERNLAQKLVALAKENHKHLAAK